MATTTDSDFVDQTTLKDILHISDAAMDQAMGIAYQLYLTKRFAEAEILCKGLVACDHRYWWSHSLHASVLRRLGRLDEALREVEEGLKYEPGQPKLALMRAELLITLARGRSTGGIANAAGQREAASAISPTSVPQGEPRIAAADAAL